MIPNIRKSAFSVALLPTQLLAVIAFDGSTANVGNAGGVPQQSSATAFLQAGEKRTKTHTFSTASTNVSTATTDVSNAPQFSGGTKGRSQREYKFSKSTAERVWRVKTPIPQQPPAQPPQPIIAPSAKTPHPWASRYPSRKLEEGYLLSRDLWDKAFDVCHDLSWVPSFDSFPEFYDQMQHKHRDFFQQCPNVLRGDWTAWIDAARVEQTANNGPPWISHYLFASLKMSVHKEICERSSKMLDQPEVHNTVAVFVEAANRQAASIVEAAKKQAESILEEARRMSAESAMPNEKHAVEGVCRGCNERVRQAHSPADEETDAEINGQKQRIEAESQEIRKKAEQIDAEIAAREQALTQFDQAARAGEQKAAADEKKFGERQREVAKRRKADIASTKQALTQLRQNLTVDSSILSSHENRHREFGGVVAQLETQLDQIKPADNRVHENLFADHQNTLGSYAQDAVKSLCDLCQPSEFEPTHHSLQTECSNLDLHPSKLTTSFDVLTNASSSSRDVRDALQQFQKKLHEINVFASNPDPLQVNKEIQTFFMSEQGHEWTVSERELSVDAWLDRALLQVASRHRKAAKVALIHLFKPLNVKSVSELKYRCNTNDFDFAFDATFDQIQSEIIELFFEDAIGVIVPNPSPPLLSNLSAKQREELEKKPEGLSAVLSAAARKSQIHSVFDLRRICGGDQKFANHRNTFLGHLKAKGFQRMLPKGVDQSTFLVRLHMAEVYRDLRKAVSDWLCSGRDKALELLFQAVLNFNAKQDWQHKIHSIGDLHGPLKDHILPEFKKICNGKFEFSNNLTEQQNLDNLARSLHMEPSRFFHQLDYKRFLHHWPSECRSSDGREQSQQLSPETFIKNLAKVRADGDSTDSVSKFDAALTAIRHQFCPASLQFCQASLNWLSAPRHLQNRHYNQWEESRKQMDAYAAQMQLAKVFLFLNHPREHELTFHRQSSNLSTLDPAGAFAIVFGLYQKDKRHNFFQAPFGTERLHYISMIIQGVLWNVFAIEPRKSGHAKPSQAFNIISSVIDVLTNCFDASDVPTLLTSINKLMKQETIDQGFLAGVMNSMPSELEANIQNRILCSCDDFLKDLRSCESAPQVREQLNQWKRRYEEEAKKINPAINAVVPGGPEFKELLSKWQIVDFKIGLANLLIGNVS